MVLSRRYALSLVRLGFARIEGKCFLSDKTYVILTNFRMQRTDHYFLGFGDLR